jgi:CPA2 family monovalent cation:H+ antiporter-2
MELPLLRELIVIFGLAIVVILLCHRVKIPAIVGFLITGVLAGPYGFGLLSAVNDVEAFATIGIVLLLFTVGMEFSLKKILEYKRYFLIGGSVQVLLTVLSVIPLAMLFGRPFGESLFIGFLLTLSSTAIVLKVLNERSESDTPHGRIIVGIMIFQDIVAIPMMLMTPLLGNGGIDVDSNAIEMMGIALVLLVAVLFAAAKIVPKLLYYIAQTRSRELFILSVLTICFSVAWLTSSIGLSLALGAFLAGLIVSESEYRHEAIGDILPFQDVFTSFFFISIGMLLDIGFVFANPLLIALLAVAAIFLKTIVGVIASLLVGVPLRTALLVGLAISQIGEFSFVLAKNGVNYGLADDFRYQLFLAVSLLTMGLTPLLIAKSNILADLVLRLPFPEILKTGFRIQNSSATLHKDHLLIVGFGFLGRNLATSAKRAGIPYAILDMNPQTVKEERIKGEPIYYGDATHVSVLQHLNLSEARMVVVVINDFTASCRIIEFIHRLYPKLYSVVRTRYFSQTHLMFELGASDVIPDELGSSVEVSTRMMHRFEIPVKLIDEIATDTRVDSYKELQRLYRVPTTLYDLKFSFPELGVDSLHVGQKFEGSGQSLASMDLRSRYGVNIIAIRRDGKVITKIDAITIIQPGDWITVTGEHGAIRSAASIFDPVSV